MFEKSGNVSNSEGQNLNLNLENSFSSHNRGEFSNQIDEKFEERKLNSNNNFIQPMICTHAAKSFKNHFMTNKNECNLLLPNHVGDSATECNNYSTCEYFTPPYGITNSSNTLQIIGCSMSDQYMSNNFIGQMAYFENGTSQPILLASCYANPQSGFNISGGNMLYQQGPCQYFVPYPVQGFGNNIQPVLPVVLPNSQPVPMLEYFNNVTYYTPIACVAPESLEGKINFSGLDSLQDKQNHQTYSEVECSSKSGKEICSIVDDDNMPEVWHNSFDDLFGTFPHKWTLIPTPLEDPNINFKAIFSDNAKVRFMCRECRNAWTSMKGCIVFWINFDSQTGEVYFRLFGQQCQKCETKEFQLSMWYPEEVRKVLKNLHVRVGHMFYGLPKVEFNVCRRQGKPRSPHNSSLCQACFNNVCTENKQ